MVCAGEVVGAPNGAGGLSQVRGKAAKFSLDMLITLASRAGKQVELAVA